MIYEKKIYIRIISILLEIINLYLVYNKYYNRYDQNCWDQTDAGKFFCRVYMVPPQLEHVNNKTGINEG
jgi:hypothetical protein